MKQMFRKIAVVSTMAIMMAGCPKESAAMVYSTADAAIYMIDGSERREYIPEGEWDIFIGRMIDLTEQGHSVVIIGDNAGRHAAKDKVTYTTSSHRDAADWCSKMKDAGYTVSIAYDKEQQVCICVAIN